MSAYRSVFQPGLFTGKVVVVTGGGSGIGRCTAHELAAHERAALGAAVATVGRKAEKLAIVRTEIEAAGGTCSTHTCDICEEDAVPATVTAVLVRHGRIDGLVNSAGGQFPSPLAAISAKGLAAIVVLLSPAAAFISSACLRIDGAAPNAKRIWPEVGTGGSDEPFNGFQFAGTPKILQG